MNIFPMPCINDEMIKKTMDCHTQRISVGFLDWVKLNGHFNSSFSYDDLYKKFIDDLDKETFLINEPDGY